MLKCILAFLFIGTLVTTANANAQGLLGRLRDEIHNRAEVFY